MNPSCYTHKPANSHPQVAEHTLTQHGRSGPVLGCALAVPGAPMQLQIKQKPLPSGETDNKQNKWLRYTVR